MSERPSVGGGGVGAAAPPVITQTPFGDQRDALNFKLHVFICLDPFAAGVDQIKCFIAPQSLRSLFHSFAVSLSDIYISSPAPSIHLMQHFTVRIHAAALQRALYHPNSRPVKENVAFRFVQKSLGKIIIGLEKQPAEENKSASRAAGATGTPQSDEF